MNYWAIFGLIFASFVGSNDNSFDLEAESITFDQNKMDVKGPFRWVSPYGIVEARSAEAHFEKDKVMKPPHLILFREEVKLLMDDQAELSAGYASLNFKENRSIFHGTQETPVVYKKPKEKLELQALRFDLFFSLHEGKHKIERLVAEGNSEIQFKNLRFCGHQLLIKEFTAKGEISKGTLLQEGVEKPCHIFSHDQEIFTEEIELFVPEKIAFLQAPKGIYKNMEPPVEFSAALAEVDLLQKEMILHPPILLEGMGRLETHGDLSIAENDEGKGIKRIVCEGPSTLTFHDAVKNQEQQLEIQGIFYIDHEKKLIEMMSPEEPEGNVLPKNQIHFSDAVGKIDADHAFIYYVVEEGHFKPIKIQLNGNVKIQNGAHDALQYALADEAILDFMTSQLTLHASKHPRVLLHDNLNKIQASATALTLTRDPATKQEIVKGAGDVRFYLSEDEFHLIKERFNFDEKSK